MERYAERGVRTDANVSRQSTGDSGTRAEVVQLNHLLGLGRHPNPAHAPLLTLACADHIPADSQDGRERARNYGHYGCKRPEACVCVCHGPGVHMYAVTGTRVITERGYSGMSQLPTFYLHPDVGGIISADHAEKIARGLLEQRNAGTVEYHLSAMLVTITPHS